MRVAKDGFIRKFARFLIGALLARCTNEAHCLVPSSLECGVYAVEQFPESEEVTDYAACGLVVQRPNASLHIIVYVRIKYKWLVLGHLKCEQRRRKHASTKQTGNRQFSANSFLPASGEFCRLEVAHRLVPGAGHQGFENLDARRIRNRSRRTIDEYKIAHAWVIAAEAILLVGTQVQRRIVSQSPAPVVVAVVGGNGVGQLGGDFARQKSLARAIGDRLKAGPRMPSRHHQRNVGKFIEVAVD